MSRTNKISEYKQGLIDSLNYRVEEKIIEKTNAELLAKIIINAETDDEADKIFQLGNMWKRTGLYYDVRLEEQTGTNIKYLKKNNDLSFDQGGIHHKLIIGDNYDALQNLLIQYKGMIDVIYIDPPYAMDGDGEFAQTNYNNGITRDNLLSMLEPRLRLAKVLLSNEGIIFCSIDDRNQAYIKCLFDEIFGEYNFIASLPTIMNLKGNQDEFGFAGTHEYTIVYSSDKSQCKINDFIVDDEEANDWEKDNIGFYKKGANLKATGTNAPREKRPNLFFPIYVRELDDGNIDWSLEEKEGYTIIYPITSGNEMSWRWSKEKIMSQPHDIIVVKNGDEYSFYKKQRPSLGDLPTKRPKSIFYKPEYSSGNGTNQVVSIFDKRIFDNPKPVDLIKDFIYLASKKESIILDFFAGSGTTGQSVLELNKEDNGNRQFILCTNNEKNDVNPNGIAVDVTSKRLKRIMTGECYDGSNNFKWLESNEPYGDSLDVYDIESVSATEQEEGKTPFDVIDEECYGLKFDNPQDKIKWVCENFEKTQKYLGEKE